MEKGKVIILDATKPTHQVKPYEQPGSNYTVDTTKVIDINKKQRTALIRRILERK